MRRSLLISTLGILVSACGVEGGPASPNRVEVEESTEQEIRLVEVATLYLHGDTAEARLVNGSDATIGHNLCTSSRERRSSDGTWVRFDPLRICTAALYPLASGAEVLLREPVDPDWEPGHYRLVTRVYRGDAGGGFEVTTKPFEVRAPN